MHKRSIIKVIIVLIIVGIIWRIMCPPSHPYQFLYDVSCVERIEICRKEVNNWNSDDPVIVLMTLDKEDHAKAFASIQKLPSWTYNGDPSRGVGEYQIRIYYDNGEIEIIGRVNNVYVSANGHVRERRDYFDEEFEMLIFNLLNEKSE